MKVKPVLDELFKEINFDTKLHKKIVINNIEFITKDEDHKNLFGSKLIGCYYLKYTIYEKNIFYNNVFNFDYDQVVNAIKKITSINTNFKIVRDDINLVTFYIAHRFLSNTSLSKEEKFNYAKEILNYFNYRTLVLLSSNYFIYPISEEKAVTLLERLSNKYIIKRLKNWNEYCQYRSEEYLKSKYLDMLVNFNKDTELPNAVSDLFNRTKDTLKSIYSEFIRMIEDDEVIKSKKTIINDIEGQEVILDKLNTPEVYFTKIERLLSDKSTFIRSVYIDVTISIIKSVSYKQLEEALNISLEFSYKNKDNYFKFKNLINGILINSIEYLQSNNIFLSNKSNVLEIINSLVGNILYARGTEINITKLKEDGDKLIKEIYKNNNKKITDRNIKNIRNSIFVYILLLALIE